MFEFRPEAAITTLLSILCFWLSGVRFGIVGFYFIDPKLAKFLWHQNNFRMKWDTFIFRLRLQFFWRFDGCLLYLASFNRIR